MAKQTAQKFKNINLKKKCFWKLLKIIKIHRQINLCLRKRFSFCPRPKICCLRNDDKWIFLTLKKPGDLIWGFLVFFITKNSLLTLYRKLFWLTGWTSIENWCLAWSGLSPSTASTNFGSAWKKLKRQLIIKLWKID